jgi:hypothetical protein
MSNKPAARLLVCALLIGALLGALIPLLHDHDAGGYCRICPLFQATGGFSNASTGIVAPAASSVALVPLPPARPSLGLVAVAPLRGPPAHPRSF